MVVMNLVLIARCTPATPSKIRVWKSLWSDGADGDGGLGLGLGWPKEGCYIVSSSTDAERQGTRPVNLCRYQQRITER